MAEEQVPDWAQEKPTETVPDWAQGNTAERGLEAGTTPLKEGAGWGEAATTAVKNVGPSAVGFGKSIIKPVSDVAEVGAQVIDWAAQKLGAAPRAPQPMETVESFGKIGAGVLEKAGLKESAGNEQYADAVGRFFADRYGGLENIKRTLAEDPVGLAADASTVLSLGGAGASRLPGVMGKAGEAVSAAGRYTNPLTPVAKGLEYGARGVAKGITGIIGGLGTGTGGESLRVAARAGYEGGEAAKAFRENIRGHAPTEDTVAAARVAVENIKKERSVAYREDMKNARTLDSSLAPQDRILDFKKVDHAVDRVAGVQTYSGFSGTAQKQVISPKTEGVRGEMLDAIGAWKNLPAVEFHTAEGLDALKRQLGYIRDEVPYGTPQRLVANKIYGAVRQTIVDWDPKYAKTMKGYEEASDLIRDLEKGLSLGEKASVDTSLRKLQTVLRNNVTTAYGRRAELAKYLVDNGSPHLMERLAGQALQPGLPRGMTRFVAQIGAEIAATLGITAGGLGLPALGGVAATLPFMSPRLMGEASYYAGRAASPLKRVPAMNVRPTGLGVSGVGRLGAGVRANTEEKKRRDVLEGLGRALSGGHKSGGRVDNRASAMRALSRTK